MTLTDTQALLPLITVATGALAVMLVVAFHRNQTVSALLTGATLLGALLTLPAAHAATPHSVGILFRVDPFAIYYIGLILVASLAVTILSHSYLEKHLMERGEFYILLLLSVLGALVLPVTVHFISFFLGIELLSVSLYVMIGYIFTRERALEATIKYLFLAGVTSAFLLFGMALVYAHAGSMEFSALAALVQSEGKPGPYLLAGAALILVGAGFKLSVVPLHQWTPDIYQGAPAPVTAFLATASKAAVLAVVLRFLYQTELLAHSGIFSALAMIAAASMTVGNVLALFQRNIKRLLAYSSIAHFGYLFVAMLSAGALGLEAATFYLTVYVAAVLGAFGIVGYLTTAEEEAETIDDYRGLFWRRPAVATGFSAMLFSLIGLPLTAGFMGKLFLVSAGVAASQWFLVIWLVLNSAIGLYYYLRIVVAMYTRTDSDTPEVSGSPAVPPFAPTVGAVLAVLTLAIVWIGVYPEFLLEWIRILSFQY